MPKNLNIHLLDALVDCNIDKSKVLPSNASRRRITQAMRRFKNQVLRFMQHSEPLHKATRTRNGNALRL